MRVRLRSLVATFLLVSEAQAATVTVSPLNSPDVSLVTVVGELALGDEEEFRSKISGLPMAIVAFSSDGGNLFAGIRIGEIVRQKGFLTMVPAGARCASACAIAWLGGSPRMMTTGAQIGFHSAFDQSTGEVSGSANALLGAYLDKLGLSENAIYYITKARPEGMTWLNQSEAEAVGIEVQLFPQKNNQQANESSPVHGSGSVQRSMGEQPLSSSEASIAERLARNVAVRLSSGPSSLPPSVNQCYIQAYVRRKAKAALYCIALDFLVWELSRDINTSGPIAYSNIRQRAEAVLAAFGEQTELEATLTRATLIAGRARVLVAEARSGRRAPQTSPAIPPPPGAPASVPAPPPDPATAALPPPAPAPTDKLLK